MSSMSKEVYEYIAQQTGDSILHRLTDQRTGEQFARYAKDQELLDKLTPTINGKTYPLPLPTYSPFHRMIQRMVSRNNRFFYKRNCDLTNKPIILYTFPLQ